MHTSTKIYTVTEYGSFVRGATSLPGLKPLPGKVFDALETYILANQSADGADAAELLSLSVRRGVGKIITARNYVGLIAMNDGTVIEILPKIAGMGVTENDSRQIFLQMLKSVKDIKFKHFDVANLNTDKLNLLEVFIRMFANEIFTLTKQGLSSGYIAVENNERFCKGKLLTAQNVTQNLVRKDRFFVRYDEFNINRPENRLIKATLSYLLRQSNDSRNRRSLSQLLSYFEGINLSHNIDADFSRCTLNRSMRRYDRAISWCRVFLRGNSFTTFAGSEVAFALLFPMEKVFESFVAARLRKHAGNDAVLRIQDNRYSLFNKPHTFSLRPDIVMERGGQTFVLDTKWKLLSAGSRNVGISQADMYQIYAYSKKYKAECAVLIYPRSDAVSRTALQYSSEDNVTVKVGFIDLLDVDTSILKLLAEMG